MKAYHNSVVLRNDGEDPSTLKLDLNAGITKKVTVRINSTQALAVIYDLDDVATGNPLTTDNNGNYAFKATDNIYDIIVAEGTANEVKLVKVEIFDIPASVNLIDDLTLSYNFDTIAAMSASLIVFLVGKKLRIQGENNKTIFYNVTASVTSKPLAGGLYALLVEGDVITEISEDITDKASIIHGTRGIVPVGDPAPVRTPWDALTDNPNPGTNSLNMTGHYIDPTVGAAYLTSGTAGYYSYIKGVLSNGNGGDNSNDHLAGICYGYHCDLTNGSHGGVFGGSFKQIQGDYSVSVGGTMHQVFALDSGIFGGRHNKIGDTGDLIAARRCAVLGGEFADIPIGEQSVILGGDSNKISANNSAIIGGQFCEILAGANNVVVTGSQVVADIPNVNVYSNGSLVDTGDNQAYEMGARRVVINNSTAYLSRTGGGSGDVYTPPANSVVTLDFTVNVLRTDVLGETASFKVQAEFTTISGALVKSGEVVTDIYNPSGYTCTTLLRGGNLNIGLRIQSVGAIDMRCTAFGKMIVQKIIP